MAWVDTQLSIKHLVYASRRLGIVHVGLLRNELIHEIKTHPQRGLLRMHDVKQMRKTWYEVQCEIDWHNFASERNETIDVYSRNYVIESDLDIAKQMYAKSIGWVWANM